MRHLHQIFNQLNLSQENGLFISSENNWKKLFSNRIERLLVNVIKPDAIFCIDNKPFILFFENLQHKKSKLKEIWNFNESPIIIISEGDAVEIYNGFEYIVNNESLKLFGGSEKLNDFRYFELVTGKTWEKYQKDFSYENRIDYHLLHNIKSARNLLISTSLSSELSNSLLGKIIFVRYLIDREVKLDFDKHRESRAWTNDEFCSLLSNKKEVKKFFNYLKLKFNGDLFPISDNELDELSTDNLSIIQTLLSGNDVNSSQASLFNLYDFSIIPVEFISNVYELFIGQNQQEEQGAYYTPLFLVDYILSETVEKKFQLSKSSYNCKVFDPSCGSGIFLVETLRKIIEQYQVNNPNYLDDPEKYKEQLKKLASDNIFGVDKDPSAINVAIFSIYLTLLDYQEPSDIATFKFPKLNKTNFFASDFFDSTSDFNTQFAKINFDFILGNPPWKRGKGEKKPLFVKYIQDRKKLERGLYANEIEISNSEIAQAFVLRVSDFSAPNTKIGLIATSKILYNLNGKGFRKYLLDQFRINKVFELAPVRREIFDKSQDKAIAPATILFYQSAGVESTDDNTIEHITLKPSRFFSLFKVFTIQRNDYQKVVQKQLKDFDFLWKILVYGNYLDFNLIRRLKEDYTKVNEIIYNNDDFLVKQGVKRTDGSKKIDVSLLNGWNFLDTSAQGKNKEIQQFFISPNHRKWALDEVGYIHRNRDKSINVELFMPPALLTTEGVDSHFQPRSAILDHNAVYTSSITAVKGDINVLLNVCGLLNSAIAPYYFLQSSSYLGIEREQINDKEDKFSLPYIDNENIALLVKSISDLKLLSHNLKSLLESTEIVETKIKIAEDQLNECIFSALSLTNQELSLLDYSKEITIPMLMRHRGYKSIYAPLHPESELLSAYAELFFDQFNHIYQKLSQKIIVRIRHSNQLLGLFFELVPIDSKEANIQYISTENNNLLQLLSALGNEQITDRLFIQKDIRGFEENGFYIIKPNEKGLWHLAIAHLDVNEFMNAILSAGKKKSINVG